jgi:hypothetical protein
VLVGIFWPSMMTMRRWVLHAPHRDVIVRVVGWCCIGWWALAMAVGAGRGVSRFSVDAPSKLLTVTSVVPHPCAPFLRYRSAYVPEEMRSTIINFFRIPLNLFVCVVLYNVRRGAGAVGDFVC